MATLPDDIFFTQNYSLDVQEYQSPPTSVAGAKKTHALKLSVTTIEFSMFRLAVAVAKSILTRDPKDIDIIKEVRAAFYVLDSMVSSTNGNLRACTGFRKKYRDFSKTSRTGELAQALTFILAQEHLDYPVVVDFDGFLDSQGIRAMDSDQKAPDFALLLRNGSMQPSLIESKGACPPKASLAPKGKFREALEQCDIADLHIATHAGRSYRARNLFGTFARISEAGDAWDSVICYCDPSADATEGMEFPISAVQRYFAAWLTLSGHLELAAALDRGQLRPDVVRNWRTERVDGVEFSIPSDHQGKQINLFTPFLAFRSPNALGSHRRMSWAVRTDLIQAIAQNDVEGVSQLLAQTAAPRTDLEKRIAYFSDHTLCFMPRLENS